MEFDVIVWYKIYPKHVVGIHPDLRKPIAMPKSGVKDNSRVVTNTSSYEEACQQLDNRLTKKKEPRVDTSSNLKLF